MTFPDRLRLPLELDPALLERDLERVTRMEWTDHFVRQNYEGRWTILPLRAAAGATHPVMMIYSDPSATAFADTPALAQTPYFRDVLAALSCQVQSARLMRLTPGSIIRPHRDHDLDAESGTARIHIPITTNPDVEFLLNGTPVPMAPGSAWYLRLSDPHSVANRGSSDRVHLVVDVVAGGGVTAMLERTVREQALPGQGGETSSRRI